jgi:negative regulator of flagellin synthesis FlgM
MKVKDASEVRSVDRNRGGPEVRRRDESAAAPASAKVSTEAAAELERTVSQVRDQLGQSRALRLEAIAAAVRNGTFKPDPQRIAQQILDDAEITAALQAMLK